MSWISLGETAKRGLFCTSQQVSPFRKKAKWFHTCYLILIVPLFLSLSFFFFSLMQSLCLGPKQTKAATSKYADLWAAYTNRIPSRECLKIHTLNQLFSYLYSVNELVFCNHHFLQLAKVCIHFYSIELGCWAIEITLYQEKEIQ